MMPRTPEDGDGRPEPPDMWDEPPPPPDPVQPPPTLMQVLGHDSLEGDVVAALAEWGTRVAGLDARAVATEREIALYDLARVKWLRDAPARIDKALAWARENAAPEADGGDVVPLRSVKGGKRQAGAIDATWPVKLARTSGGPRANLSNVSLALAHSPEWAGVLAWNEFRQTIVSTSALPTSLDYADLSRKDAPHVEIADIDAVRAAIWMQREAGVQAKPETVYHAMEIAARQRSFHPVRQMIEAEPWDRIPRIDSWLHRCCNAPNTDYFRNVGIWWLISGIARVYNPGCKADHVLIFEGDQGAGKSTLASILSLGFFTDSDLDLTSKDKYLLMRGRFVVELAELDSLSKHDAGKVKAFLTGSTDSYRPPYAHGVVDMPRQCIFIGTVNLAHYLKDETGGRRFWPVPARQIDCDLARAEVRQWWAEALHRYRAGERWYPRTPEEHALCVREQTSRRVSDPWEPIVAGWLEARVAKGKHFTSLLSVMVDCLRLDQHRLDGGAQHRVTSILTALRWKLHRVRIEDGDKTTRPRLYKNPDAPADAEPNDSDIALPTPPAQRDFSDRKDPPPEPDRD